MQMEPNVFMFASNIFKFAAVTGNGSRHVRSNNCTGMYLSLTLHPGTTWPDQHVPICSAPFLTNPLQDPLQIQCARSCKRLHDTATLEILGHLQT